MKRRKSGKVSLGDVARAAKISVTSAGCALKNLPGVSEETRREVVRIAKRLGYFPDARLSTHMTEVRKASDKDLLPIVWLNSDQKKNAWTYYRFLSPYQEGARQRLQELGYRIEEMWTRQSMFSMRRLAQLIDYQRIPGVIITGPIKHVRLKWDEVAAVSIGEGLLAPPVHRVAPDINFNFALALKMVKRFGYRRIGICLSEEADRFSRHGIRSMAMYLNSMLPKSSRIEPLFISEIVKMYDDDRMVAAWLKKERPDVVVGSSNRLVTWVQAAGFSVPHEVGVVHLATDDDVAEWAGIYANKRDVGRIAADKLVSLIQNRQFGIPGVASTTFVRGVWRSGATLLVHKPRTEEAAPQPSEFDAKC